MRAVFAACASTATFIGRRARMPRCQRVARSVRDRALRHDRAGAEREQLAQADVALPADALVAPLAGAGVLPWRQSRPGGEVAGRAELPAVADGGDDGMRGDAPYAGKRVSP